jgi:hypothetical protein
MVAIRLVGLPDEFAEDQAHAMSNRIRDPLGTVLSEVTGELRIGVASARSDYLAGVTLPSAVRFKATEEGAYALEYEFGSAARAVPVHVVIGTPQ